MKTMIPNTAQVLKEVQARTERAEIQRELKAHKKQLKFALKQITIMEKKLKGWVHQCAN